MDGLAEGSLLAGMETGLLGSNATSHSLRSSDGSASRPSRSKVSAVDLLSLNCTSTVHSSLFPADCRRDAWPHLSSSWLGLTSARSKIFTIPSCPFSAAHQSGLRPNSVSAWLGLTSSRSEASLQSPHAPTPPPTRAASDQSRFLPG